MSIAFYPFPFGNVLSTPFMSSFLTILVFPYNTAIWKGVWSSASKLSIYIYYWASKKAVTSSLPT